MIIDKNKKCKILIVSAHPDDEVLGCGATIAKHVSYNHEVFCISLTDGVRGRSFSKKEISFRSNAFSRCAKYLGFKVVNIKGRKFKDQRLDNYNFLDVVKVIEKAKKLIDPDIVYTHSMSDLNMDHRISAEATFVAFRPKSLSKFTTLISYEVPSATDYGKKIIYPPFLPNFFVNINNFFKKKIEALKIYEKEILDYPNSRSIKSIEALAILRGSQNGIKLAEAFEIIKIIDR